MDQELKAKWVEALRSGKYEQATGWLREGNRYCCLGVLCDISGQGEWEPINNPTQGYKYLGYVAVMPEEIAQFGEQETTLVLMNDRGKPFTDIADWIEQNL